MKKGVIFDLDGTLINSLPDIAAAMNRALEKSGLPGYAEEAYKYKVGNGVLRLAQRAVGEHTECYQAVLDAYRADYALHCRVASQPYKGVPEMLEGLIRRGLKVCVLSNKDQADVESVVSYYFPTINFSAVLGRAEGTPLKPAPDGALRIARELGLAPQDFWYVGDTGTDMRCGNAAGMATVGVLWGFRTREELAANGAGQLIDDPFALLTLADAYS